MKLTRHKEQNEAYWACNGTRLNSSQTLSSLLRLPTTDMLRELEKHTSTGQLDENITAPVDDMQEVWAAGVTYLKSREARMEESDTADIYDKVYEADRPEVFFKGNGWRVRGPGQSIRVRKDSDWNVPEPELAIVINSNGEVVGYTAGNDVSSRSIEGENPLYLPQAKVYTGSAALGDSIILCDQTKLVDLKISMRIDRNSKTIFDGETNTSQLKRGLSELADCLFQELEFPDGAVLMTGTCLVPEDPYTLLPGDTVSIQVGEVSLQNTVVA